MRDANQNYDDFLNNKMAFCDERFNQRVEIYKGTTCIIYKATDQATGQIVALKAYPRSLLNERQKRKLERELITMILIGGDWVVGLKGSYEECDVVYLVLEWCHGGDLFRTMNRQVLKDNSLPSSCVFNIITPFEEYYVCVNIIAPLLRVLEKMHALRLVHRDIKPENLFLSKTGSLRVGDYGLAIDSSRELPFSRSGTLDYMAPEVLKNPEIASLNEMDSVTREQLAQLGVTPYGCEVDIWACGVLAFELIIGKPPFELLASATALHAYNASSTREATHMAIDATYLKTNDNDGNVSNASTNLATNFEVASYSNLETIRLIAYGSQDDLNASILQGLSHRQQLLQQHEKHRQLGTPIMSSDASSSSSATASTFNVITASVASAKPSRLWADFVASALTRDPGFRPSASDLLRHPWIQESLQRALRLKGTTQATPTSSPSSPSTAAIHHVRSTAKRVLKGSLPVIQEKMNCLTAALLPSSLLSEDNATSTASTELIGGWEAPLRAVRGDEGELGGEKGKGLWKGGIENQNMIIRNISITNVLSDHGISKGGFSGSASAAEVINRSGSSHGGGRGREGRSSSSTAMGEGENDPKKVDDQHETKRLNSNVAYIRNAVARMKEYDKRYNESKALLNEQRINRNAASFVAPPSSASSSSSSSSIPFPPFDVEKRTKTASSTSLSSHPSTKPPVEALAVMQDGSLKQNLFSSSSPPPSGQEDATLRGSFLHDGGLGLDPSSLGTEAFNLHQSQWDLGLTMTGMASLSSKDEPGRKDRISLSSNNSSSSSNNDDRGGTLNGSNSYTTANISNQSVSVHGPSSALSTEGKGRLEAINVLLSSALHRSGSTVSFLAPSFALISGNSNEVSKASVSGKLANSGSTLYYNQDSNSSNTSSLPISTVYDGGNEFLSSSNDSDVDNRKSSFVNGSNKNSMNSRFKVASPEEVLYPKHTLPSSSTSSYIPSYSDMPAFATTTPITSGATTDSSNAVSGPASSSAREEGSLGAKSVPISMSHSQPLSFSSLASSPSSFFSHLHSSLGGMEEEVGLTGLGGGKKIVNDDDDNSTMHAIKSKSSSSGGDSSSSLPSSHFSHHHSVAGNGNSSSNSGGLHHRLVFPSHAPHHLHHRHPHHHSHQSQRNPHHNAHSFTTISSMTSPSFSAPTTATATTTTAATTALHTAVMMVAQQGINRPLSPLSRPSPTSISSTLSEIELSPSSSYSVPSQPSSLFNTSATSPHRLPKRHDTQPLLGGPSSRQWPPRHGRHVSLGGLLTEEMEDPLFGLASAGSSFLVPAPLKGEGNSISGLSLGMPSNGINNINNINNNSNSSSTGSNNNNSTRKVSTSNTSTSRSALSSPLFLARSNGSLLHPSSDLSRSPSNVSSFSTSATTSSPLTSLAAQVASKGLISRKGDLEGDKGGRGGAERDVKGEGRAGKGSGLSSSRILMDGIESRNEGLSLFARDGGNFNSIDKSINVASSIGENNMFSHDNDVFIPPFSISPSSSTPLSPPSLISTISPSANTAATTLLTTSATLASSTPLPSGTGLAFSKSDGNLRSNNKSSTGILFGSEIYLGATASNAASSSTPVSSSNAALYASSTPRNNAVVQAYSSPSELSSQDGLSADGDVYVGHGGKQGGAKGESGSVNASGGGGEGWRWGSSDKSHLYASTNSASNGSNTNMMPSPNLLQPFSKDAQQRNPHSFAEGDPKLSRMDSNPPVPAFRFLAEQHSLTLDLTAAGVSPSGRTPRGSKKPTDGRKTGGGEGGNGEAEGRGEQVSGGKSGGGGKGGGGGKETYNPQQNVNMKPTLMNQQQSHVSATENVTSSASALAAHTTIFGGAVPFAWGGGSDGGGGRGGGVRGEGRSGGEGEGLGGGSGGGGSGGGGRGGGGRGGGGRGGRGRGGAEKGELGGGSSGMALGRGIFSPREILSQQRSSSTARAANSFDSSITAGERMGDGLGSRPIEGDGYSSSHHLDTHDRYKYNSKATLCPTEALGMAMSMASSDKLPLSSLSSADHHPQNLINRRDGFTSKSSPLQRPPLPPGGFSDTFKATTSAGKDSSSDSLTSPQALFASMMSPDSGEMEGRGGREGGWGGKKREEGRGEEGKHSSDSAFKVNATMSDTTASFRFSSSSAQPQPGKIIKKNLAHSMIFPHAGLNPSRLGDTFSASFTSGTKTASRTSPSLPSPSSASFSLYPASIDAVEEGKKSGVATDPKEALTETTPLGPFRHALQLMRNTKMGSGIGEDRSDGLSTMT